MGRRDEEVTDEVLFAGPHPDPPLAAAPLGAIGGDRGPLHVTGVGHGDRHVLVRDQIFNPELAFLLEDHGAPLVAVALADRVQLGPHHLHQQLVARQDRAQPLDQLEDLGQLVDDLLPLEPGQPLQLHYRVGDVVLRGVAQTLSENLRGTDMIGRYGGEEFMLILTETDVEEGAFLAEKLRTLVQRQRYQVEGGQVISVTISIGIAGGVGNKVRMETLIRDADAAMYSAKSLGRNQTYIFAEPDDDNRVPRAPYLWAVGRARALKGGPKPARDAATNALTSVLLPLPHYRGQPSPVIATIVVSMARQLQLPDADIDRLRICCPTARCRQGRRAEGVSRRLLR